MDKIGLYAKAILGAIGAGLTATITALSDGNISTFEWTVIAGAVLAGLGFVWLVPNTPEPVRKYGKMIVAALIAVAGGVGAAVVDGSGVSQAEWLGVAVALLSGLGVYVAPNAASSDPVDPATNKQVAVPAEVKEAIVAQGSATVEVANDKVVAVG